MEKEILFLQRFNYAEIQLFKNYSLLKINNLKNYYYNTSPSNDDLKNLILIDENDDDDFFSKPQKNNSSYLNQPINYKKIYSASFPSEASKFKSFFYDDNLMRPCLFESVENPFTKNTYFYTTNDSKIKKYIPHPFASIEINLVERIIYKKNNKLTFKYYFYRKSRRFNQVYLKLHTKINTGLTLDLNTGDFYIFLHTKDKKIIRKNCFQELSNFLNKKGKYDFLNNESFNLEIKEEKFKKKYLGTINNDILNYDVLKIFKKELGIMEHIFQKITTPKLDLMQMIIPKFVELKKIKVPNQYEKLLTTYYPHEKYFKKNDRKLIAAILDKYKIKTKSTIKLIHDRPTLNIDNLYQVLNILGDNYQNYISKINFNIKLFIPAEDKSYMANDDNLFSPENSLLKLTTDREKNNFIQILNEDKFTNFIGLVQDHIRMINMIKKYDPTVSFSSKTSYEFNMDHNNFTKILSSIKKGYYVEYIFHENLVSNIELKMIVDDIPLYPYILKNEYEYHEEGKFMHHCVATYVEKKQSIIISIRTEDKQDRVTCEFNCQTGRLIQARHFCNGVPPEIFQICVDQLSLKTEYYARLGLLNSLDKKHVPIQIQGKQLVKEDFQELNRILLPF
jgi:PcfJ-like protein